MDNILFKKKPVSSQYQTKLESLIIKFKLWNTLLLI